MNNKNIKPFYIYTDKRCLYIKNINEQTEKLANNIFSYSANIDDNENIHICGLDSHGKLTHFFNTDGHWRKKVIIKVFNSIKNIKDMRLYIINDFLNVFIVEKYPISDNLYKVSHFNFNPSNYKISRYTINNIYKGNEYIYKLNIDEMSNIIFEYNISNTISRNTTENKIVFDSISRLWSNPNTLNNESSFDIKSDIFKYCSSIKYKL
ncbi:hypothetical protein QOZ84_04915 [Romboutsia sedimentorum]|uniref:Uncharacterized protein n=1 Tax=Romboutsia sedimentorum TaxID=1368474 RepID=A0ABT7EA87_9FIRM|nr:hypothetical protein [Romboutsia sedimentorum]MDK2562881.1 hypothetical protein [Romboutsia sedimentorum]MDK2585636.1 hypothetical protein [Romboutsia sedimentorum]